jgi:hypothetical protein
MYKPVIDMTKSFSIALYIVALIAVVVTMDLLFFRQRLWFWERLMVNIGIVLMFLGFFLRFTRIR